jgi:PAS domain S-box-containing protein
MRVTSEFEQQNPTGQWLDLDDLWVITDSEGQIRSMNAEARQHLGFGESNRIDHSMVTRYQGLFVEAVLPTLKQSGAWDGIILLRHAISNAELPVYAKAVSLYEPGVAERPSGFVFSFRILIGHPVFQGLKVTRDGFPQFLTDNIVEGIYVLDRNGIVIFMNPAAEKMLGWEPGTLLGRSIHEAVHYQKLKGSSYPESGFALITAVKAGQVVTQHQDTFLRADGTSFPVLCTSAPLIGEAAEVVGAVLTFHDISAQKRTEEELQHSKVELEAANFLLSSVTSVQTNFIAGMDQWTLWERFIQDILALTSSEFGYIGEVYYKDSGAPYLVFRGLTNIAWSPETQVLFEGLKTRGLEFHNLENLYGVGLKNGGCTVISNNPAHDPRRGGLPPGHPPLHSFMGLPIYGKDGALIGQVGLANRPGGYDVQLEEYLMPLLVTCSYIIEAYRNIEFRKLSDKALEAQYELTQIITDNATAALFMMDKHGYCTFMNPAAEKMTGYSFEEIRHQPLHNMIHHTHPDGTPFPLAECPIDRALPEKNQVRWHEDVFVRKDGTFFSVVCAAEPIIRDGEPVGTVVEVRDVTEEKRAQQAIIESEKRFRSLADSAPIMIWVTDAQGKVEYLNETFHEFTGLSPEQDLNTVWLEAVHADDRAYFSEVFQAALRYKRKFEVEYRLLNAHGEYRWLLSTGKPRGEVDGTCIGMIGSSIDITERRQAREELERLVTARTAQLQSANQELEAFCYSVSHDLRAPLRGIDGFSLAILEDYGQILDAQGQDYLNRVRLETQRMGQLIDDMLKLSRLTRGELKEEPIDLSAMARDILAQFSESEPQRKVKADIEEGLTAVGDARLMYAALQNLLSNAWKFTSKREAAHIEFGKTIQDDQTVYFIHDNGAGFNMAYIDKLFGAFQRLHHMSEFSGTGVGLATVQRIIHRHGGKIWAEGEPDGGATFYFTLDSTLS